MRTRITLAIALLALPAAAHAGAIQMDISGVRDSKGNIHVEICTERNWLKTCAFATNVPARQGVTHITVPDVPPGRYAVQAYHDRDGNGKANRNFIGMPTEDVGFSNNALKKLAPPKFADAAIDHGAGDTRIRFFMKDL